MNLAEHREHMQNGPSQGPCSDCGSQETRTYTIRPNCSHKKIEHSCRDLCDIRGIFCKACKMFR